MTLRILHRDIGGCEGCSVSMLRAIPMLPENYEIKTLYTCDEIQELQDGDVIFISGAVCINDDESILLAKEINADALIIDERTGYKIAKFQGINAIGTLSILLLSKERGLIEVVKPLLDDMIIKGRWYSSFVYENFLKQIGEL